MINIFTGILMIKLFTAILQHVMSRINLTMILGIEVDLCSMILTYLII